MVEARISKRSARFAGAALLSALVAGCAPADAPSAAAADPFEEPNRRVHEFNKRFDQNVLKPASEGYVAVVPRPVRRGVSNGVNNLSQPMNVINHTLQGDIDDASVALFRFAMNTVFGFGGLLDPATEAGLYDNPTDFGETMATWGIPSGAYLELPFLGPSTPRAAFGAGVDFFANPVRQVVSTETAYVLVGAQVADVLQTRNDLARVIETLLYESADSYSATRIAYLQNRARNMRDGLAAEDLEDPYAFE